MDLSTVFLNFWLICFILLAAHGIGDYPLQGEFLATYKSESLLVLIIHSVIYSACIIGGFYIIDMIYHQEWKLGTYAYISFLMVTSHICIDYTKCRYREYLKKVNPNIDDPNSIGHKYDVIGFYLDQACHFIILLGTILVFLEI